ncbi:unnamed protein product [Caenorhabditis sp. 36 PRJEB53466]|nr:unnamed protein product [Caenorhabditis sp. 36 PRJEB53466]
MGGWFSSPESEPPANSYNDFTSHANPQPPRVTTTYSTPSYSTPSYSTPSYSTPSYSTPSYSTPSYSTQSYRPVQTEREKRLQLIESRKSIETTKNVFSRFYTKPPEPSDDAVADLTKVHENGCLVDVKLKPLNIVNDEGSGPNSNAQSNSSNQVTPKKKNRGGRKKKNEKGGSTVANS